MQFSKRRNGEAGDASKMRLRGVVIVFAVRFMKKESIPPGVSEILSLNLSMAFLTDSTVTFTAPNGCLVLEENYGRNLL